MYLIFFCAKQEKKNATINGCLTLIKFNQIKSMDLLISFKVMMVYVGAGEKPEGNDQKEHGQLKSFHIKYRIGGTEQIKE